jgi:dTMP kinase
MNREGKYLVIEGHDGTGKSTQVGLVRELLKDAGVESIEFHEPDGTPMAGEIRTLLKNGSLERDPVTNLFLFSAARREIWLNRALPALKMGAWVVAARNYYSTLAYQGYGEGIDTDTILSMTRTATDERYMQPDLALILDLDDESERSRRIGERGVLENTDTFESKDGKFQSDVKNGYRQIASDYNLPIILADQPLADVTSEIYSHIRQLN